MPRDPVAALIPLLRSLVNSSIANSQRTVRVPRVLAGTIEDVDDDLDVAYVRLDQEATAGDPTQSDQWGAPGVIPATRLGEAVADEQVRVSFDGSAGASANRTGGADVGRRIVMNQTAGTISFYNAEDELVGFLDANQWAVGDLDPAGARATLDPVGGLRLRAVGDKLVALLDQRGLTLRDETDGLVTAEVQHGSFRLVDPNGTDDIEMVTSSLGTLPNPKYANPATTETNPGTTIAAPACARFTTNPADDVSIYHAAAFLAGTSQAATWTPPGGTTERSDTVHNTGTDTLAVSVATTDPATGAAVTFTSSQSNWTHGIGTHVVVRGGGTTSPSFRSLSEVSAAPITARRGDVTLAKPTGVVAGDALVALVTLGNRGGSIPTSWSTPAGWKFLGAAPLVVGANTLAVGAWVKLATASEPADYTITINYGDDGTKRVHATIVAIQNPFLIPGGAHIRTAGHPIRKLIAQNEITTASATLCDFQNIPGGFDHLELIYEALSDRATDALRNIRARFNADAVDGNYRWQTTRDGVITGSGAGTQDRIIIGGVDGGALNAESGGILQILGYARPHRRFYIGNEFFIRSTGDLIEEHARGLWLNSTDPITRVGVSIDSGTTLFNVGSRAYLYGY